MQFYDTHAKRVVTFAPKKTVRLYVCGITPYDAAHLGHIFTFMTYDLLQRRLEDLSHTVQLVRNITDVDEPIFKKARELGVPYMELANQEIDSFHHVMGRLNFRPLFSEPRASEYIEEMAAAVQRLLDLGYAYRLESDIYFDVHRDPSFGELSGYDSVMQRRLMAKRGGDPTRPGKHQPLDFQLWRGIADPDDPAAWDTVVGRGRPGWHIECSIMSSELLGLPFDIHGGGDDLIFPHHECEIAQARGLGHPKVADHWLHVAPLLLYGEKMSKSLGNLIFAKDLLKDYHPSVIRLALMNYHYRIGGEWYPTYLEQAAKLYERLCAILPTMSGAALQALAAEIRAALDDNLDTPRVIQILYNSVKALVASSDNESAAECATLQELLGIELV